MHVQRDVSGIYNHGQVVKGEISPKKADYDRCSHFKPIIFTLKCQLTTTLNGKKTYHIILLTSCQVFILKNIRKKIIKKKYGMTHSAVKKYFQNSALYIWGKMREADMECKVAFLSFHFLLFPRFFIFLVTGHEPICSSRNSWQKTRGGSCFLP